MDAYKRFLAALVATFVAAPAFSSQVLPTPLMEALSARLPQDQSQPLVFVTLSTTCPCSVSHMAHLSELAKSYPDLTFVGIHADSSVSQEEAQGFFEAQNLAFSVWSDADLALSRALGAVTTPQAFVYQANKGLFYRGAVSSGSQFSDKNRAYLSEALSSLKEGKRPPRARTRPRGCEINYPSASNIESRPLAVNCDWRETAKYGVARLKSHSNVPLKYACVRFEPGALSLAVIASHFRASHNLGAGQ